MLKSLFRRPWRGAVKPVVLLALLVPVVGGGVLAYNLFFNRPGESAIKLIPQDALMVVTLDLTPTPQQIPTFKRIWDAVEREGLTAELDKTMTDAMDKSPVAAELRPYVSRSFAIAMLNSPSEKSEKDNAVAMLAITDAAKVQGILGKHATKSQEAGVDVYQMKNGGDSKAALIGQYLVFGKGGEQFSKIQSVQQGKAEPLEKSADYQQARSSLPKDANLMVFISPEGLKKFAKENGQGQVNEQALSATRYFTAGLTIRDQGLELVGQVPTTLPEGSPLKSLGTVAAVDPNVLKKLPAGALGVFAFSQPGKYWQPVTSTAMTVEQRSEMANGLKQAEQQLGLSVNSDVVPALSGNLVLAVYPDQLNPTGSVDGVLLVDDSHGADPAALAEKLRPVFAKNEVPLVDDTSGTHKIVSAAQPVAGKTPCYAQVGKALILASSRQLLDGAIASFSAPAAEATPANSLISTPSFAGMQQAVLPGAQAMLLVDLRKILETFRPAIEPAINGDKDLKFDDLLGLFGTPNSGLAASGKYDGASGGFQLHVPLDYDKLVHLIAVGSKKARSGEMPGIQAPDQATEGQGSVIQ